MNLGAPRYVAPPVDESTRSLAEELLVNPTPQLLDLPEEAEHYQARSKSASTRGQGQRKDPRIYCIPGTYYCYHGM